MKAALTGLAIGMWGCLAAANDHAAACRVGAVVVQDCVAALRERDQYTDSYLRGVRQAAADRALAAERLRQQHAQCAARGIRVGQPAIGMAAKDARVCGWGPPQAVRRRTDAAGSREIWLYPGGRALIVEGGEVVVIEE